MDQPVVINRYVPEVVELYSPTHEFIGYILNEHELHNVQIQVASQRLEGYYITWRDYISYIKPNGELTNWPKGMYTKTQEDLITLAKIRLKNGKLERILSV